MSTRSEAVKRWRTNSKIRIVKAMGGKCVICGYDKCTDALDLHHLDPSKKEISFGGIRANPRAWSRIVKELRKCVVLCSNHHREIHNGIITMPEFYQKFDESFSEYKFQPNETVTPCPICGKMKADSNITCSRSCAAKKSRKVDWDKIDLIALLKEGKTKIAIAETVGVSEAAVRKRIKKLLKY